MLNKLIERIEIGHTEIVDEQTQQELMIAWRFCGEIK